MILIIFGILVVIAVVVTLILRSKSIKDDARKIEEQAKRRNES